MIPEIVDSEFPWSAINQMMEYGKPNAEALILGLKAIHEQLVVNAALLRELIGWAQNN